MEKTIIKLRKLKVKLKKPLFYEGTRPEELRDFILDNRIRQCRVEVERMTISAASPTMARSSSRNGLNQRQQLHQIRRCCVRIPRVDAVDRSEISSTPSNSIVHNDSFIIDDFLDDTV